MKIGILTLPLHTNYGGILQAYALQTILERVGHQVKVIKWEQKDFKGHPWYKAVFIYGKRLLLRKELFVERRKQRDGKVVYRNVEDSIDRMIHYTDRTICSRSDLIDYCNMVKFDVLVVGSDQVWRKSYNDDIHFFDWLSHKKSFPSLDTYFLDFVAELDSRPKCIAYAASFGVDYAEYTDEEANKFGMYLKAFDMVSVREKQGVSLIQDVYHWRDDAVWFLDPTMLLSSQDYIHLLGLSGKVKVTPYLLHYVLDETTDKAVLAEDLSKRLSIPIKTISPNRKDGNSEKRVQPSVEEWVSLFASADFVLTDSFHGMVFSVIFNKPFYVIGNKMRGMARFDSFLGMLGLADRMIAPGEKVEVDREIDWERVNAIRQMERERCAELLKAL